MIIKLLPFILFCSLSSHGHTLKYFAGTPLKIIKIGHPTLKKVAKEVEYSDISKKGFQKFIDDMFETMKKGGGVGLAAPQVNVSRRIFVMGGSGIPRTAVINPKVEYLDQYGTKISREGCLSIPRKRFKVKRYKRIYMEYFNRRGDYVKEEAKGFKAIVAQHEYDHLNGVLISDQDQLVLGSEFEVFEYDALVPEL